jgi:nucleotide-binding universal stress UspA family protein
MSVMYQTIVVATDGAEGGDRAVATARSLANEAHTRLVVVHVNEVMTGRLASHPVHPNEAALQDKIRHQVQSLKLDGVQAELKMHRVASGHPARPIAEDAREVKADLIVTGTGRRGPLAGMFFGGVVTQELVRIASCPVLAVPPSSR